MHLSDKGHSYDPGGVTTNYIWAENTHLFLVLTHCNLISFEYFRVLSNPLHEEGLEKLDLCNVMFIHK